MKRTVKVISDPGHAWASVPKADIKGMRIAGKISGFSYEKGNRVYLEEDRDLAIYMQAAEYFGLKVDLKFSHSGRRSWVRNLNHYDPACIR